MSGGGGGGKRKSTKTKTADDPLHSLFAAEDSFSAVDDLLRAAEDDLLLKLRVGAHSTTRPAASGLSPASTSSLDPDLLLRLEALKSPPPPPPPSGAAAPAPASAVVLDDEWGAILGDDLAARFAALKGSSASGSISIHDVAGSAGPIATRVDMKLGASKEDDGGVSEEEDEDEVEKLLQWAMDAARLDTADSKNNNDDDDDDDDDDADSKSEDDDDVEDDDDEKESRRKNGAGKVLLQPPLLFSVPHLLWPPLLLRPQLQPRAISSST